MTKTSMTLYIDMDEVLVDSTDGILAAKGLDNPYDDSENLGKYNVHELVGQTWPEFWESITQEQWVNLKKLPWADKLIELAESLESDNILTWRFLTSPILNPACFAGKFEWVEKNYPQHAGKIIIGRNKQDIVGKNDLLIDDSETNMKYMKESDKEGNMFMFPAKSNHLFEQLPQNEEEIEDLIDFISVKAVTVSFGIVKPSIREMAKNYINNTTDEY